MHTRPPGGRTATVLWLIVAIAAPATAQQKLFTIDDLYDPARAIVTPGRASQAPTVAWLSDTHYVVAKPVPGAPGRFTQVRVDAASGTEAPLFDAGALERALARVPGVAPEEPARLARQHAYALSPSADALLVSIADDLYAWRFGADRTTRLTSAPGEEETPSFSPDGRMVAFVRQSNLHVVDMEGRERPLTTDGHARLLNGKLDWLYQEEIYGRGRFNAFWWSPDSTRLAYLQLDESPVPEFTVVDHIPRRQGLEITNYPKPGDPNPIVKLGIVRAAGGPTAWVDLGKYTPTDLLIVDVDWTPDSRRVVFQAQNREQTWLDLNLGDAGSGSPVTTVLRETTRAWVNNAPTPRWLKDGSFLWLSERSGWKHVYHHRHDGTLLRQVTDGKWEARTLHGVDEAGGWVYFSGTERSHIGGDVYRVRLDGSGLKRLSSAEGTHTAWFNPALTMYADKWSTVTTPPQVRLHRADGAEVRVIERESIPALAEYRLSTPEFLQVPTRDGFRMEAMIIKPPDFDPSRTYPVLQHTYAGPQSQQVKNAWGGASALYFQLLAQKGIVVWVCDNRTASGKGAESAWPAYKRLGVSELEDIEDGVAWLTKQRWVDGTRIGISGWSYGGFIVSYALTHSTSFAMGIAGGSVTDWRGYDSIYTERYMLTPQNNPDGYQRTAPRAAATQLSGRLLLVHGIMDDNVHVQNTVQFAYELQRAGKPFELMLYPRSRHGVTDPLLLKHLQQTMLDFTLRTLVPASASPPTTATGPGALVSKARE